MPGPWLDRLPHFRLDHTPSHGDELQSEFFVAREHAVAAFAALDTFRDRLAPLVFVSEIRTIAADDLWLSPAFAGPRLRSTSPGGRTGRRSAPSCPAIESALEPFEPRPHWAKLFTMAPEVVRSRYARMDAFAELATRLDPRGDVPQRVHPAPRVRGRCRRGRGPRT